MSFDITVYEDAASELKAFVGSLTGRIEAVQKAFDNAILREEELQQELTDYEEALAICESALADSALAKSQMESLMTIVFQATVGKHYSFEYAEVANSSGEITGLKPLIYEFGIGRSPEEYGTGMNNLWNSASRWLMIVVINHFLGVKYRQAPILLLDEPFSNADLDNWEMFVEMFKYLMQDVIKFQVLTISHAAPTMPHNYRVSKLGTVSKVVKVTP